MYEEIISLIEKNISRLESELKDKRLKFAWEGIESNLKKERNNLIDYEKKQSDLND